MAGEAQNQATMDEALVTLEQMAENHSSPRMIKQTLTELIAELKSTEYGLSVRAANAISVLDDLTQDPNMPSYVRTQLWQAVSKLEGIRE